MKKILIAEKNNFFHHNALYCTLMQLFLYFRLQSNKICIIIHIKMTKNEIGQIIKDRRFYLGITQKDLTEIVDISLRSLVDIENGNGNPTIDQLNKILYALGLTIKISAL